MELMNIPLPATLPECENQVSVDYFETKGTVSVTNPPLPSRELSPS